MSFRNLEIWRKAIVLSSDVYTATNTFPKHEVFGLASQMQRASVSVSSNISEGYRRNSKKEFAAFLGYARGSVGELESQTEIALLQKYISENDRNNLVDKCDELSKMIWSFRKTLK
jgi:four helix bundle protein